MTFGTFIYRNAFRNKRRTALTVLSIGFSLFLLILLNGLMDFFNNPPTADESALRLVVQRTTSFVDGLPLSYLPKLETVKGVKCVVPVQIYGAYYREAKNVFPMLAIDPVKVWEMFPEQHLSDEAKKVFAEDRRGAIVGKQLVERYGWKVGDAVTLIGTMHPVDLEFTVSGIYESEISTSNDAFYFHYNYFNEALGTPNTVGFIWLLAQNADVIPQIIEDTNKMFRNTPAETKTESEKSFILGMISMIGNIKALMGSIAGVVVFTMLIVVGSTIAMTIRERFREVGILKAIGYTRKTVLTLILGEAVFIAACGGALGCLMAWSLRFVDIYTMTRGMIPGLPVRPHVFGAAVLIGIGVGFISSLLPALKASSLTITGAMRRVE